MSRIDRERYAAVRTLKRLGYTYHGGEEWKPPLGKALDAECVFEAHRDPMYSVGYPVAPVVPYCTTHQSYSCSQVNQIRHAFK